VDNTINLLLFMTHFGYNIQKFPAGVIPRRAVLLEIPQHKCKPYFQRCLGQIASVIPTHYLPVGLQVVSCEIRQALSYYSSSMYDTGSLQSLPHHSQDIHHVYVGTIWYMREMDTDLPILSSSHVTAYQQL